jgi:serine/threonine-protein kinase HipA
MACSARPAASRVSQPPEIAARPDQILARFDRTVEDEVVRRIHQEDFAPALGLPCELKHQRKGRPGRRFDVGAALTVLDQTRDPDAARLAFLKTTVFNLCTGNTDTHAKNHAVLYDRPGPPRFAPLYDMLSIRLSRQFTHELAYTIGAAPPFDAMTRADLDASSTRWAWMSRTWTSWRERELTPLVEALEGRPRACNPPG